MIYRKLGPTGIKVSAIGYGNWVNSDSKEAQHRRNSPRGQRQQLQPLARRDPDPEPGPSGRVLRPARHRAAQVRKRVHGAVPVGEEREGTKTADQRGKGEGKD